MKSAFTGLMVALMAIGCTSYRVDADRTLVPVEAVVVSYGEDQFTAHGEGFAVLIDQKIPAAHLEVRKPEGPFDRRLVVYSQTALPEGHPLRQIGAVVEFITERRYLVALLSDPTKPHDTAFLYVDQVRGLKGREPIQPPQHNAGSRPSSGDSSASKTPSSLGPRG